MDKRIELSGFREIDASTMGIVVKNITHHMRKFEEITKRLERLHIVLKKVHAKEKSVIYEIQAKLLDNGKTYASEVYDRNLLAGIDIALEKIINEISR